MEEIEMTLLQSRDIKNKPGSSQAVEQIANPPSTNDDEKSNESEDSADSKTGLEEKVKKSSPLLRPSTPVENVPDVTLDTNADASASALADDGDEQGSTAAASDTNTHPVPADSDHEATPEDEPPYWKTMIVYVIRRALCHPLWWLCVICGIIIVLLYYLQVHYDFYHRHIRNSSNGSEKSE